VGIARALYRRPRLLVLDEATSALDNATEQRITETIERLSGLVTVVIVAHRLSSVRKAGTVVFMAEGSVAAEGTFAEVEAQSPQFSELVSLGRV
jgi:ABC-type multidrug transport system fused ATPase/permease subunit